MLTASQSEHSNYFGDKTNPEDNIQNNNTNGQNVVEGQQNDEQEVEEPEVDITINNVVCNFSVKCHLNLRQIATNGTNVEYRREHSMIALKLRNPLVTANIWSSGKITCTGATTESDAKRAARRVARMLQKMGFKVRFSAYRIVNVLGSCNFPFGIKIHELASLHRDVASYEPELHPGATYRMKDIKAVLKIFQTGSITITAPSIINVQTAVERIYPIVYTFKKPKPQSSLTNSYKAKMKEKEKEKEKAKSKTKTKTKTKGKKRKRISESDQEMVNDNENIEDFFSSENEDLDESDYSDKSD